MLTAPRGVTKMAGAYAYAAKFATSPVITANIPFFTDKYQQCPVFNNYSKQTLCSMQN